jgi:predicted O-linked N-acetylglucosamine transferase (SPINDLY family)
MTTGMTPQQADDLVARGLKRLVANDLREADGLFRSVLESWPQYAQASALRAAVAHRSGDLEAAREHLQRAVDLDVATPEHPCNLAVILCSLGRLAEAEQILRRALAIRPEHVETRVNLGTVLTSSGRHEEAIACFDRAVALKPDLAEAHRHASKALMKLGRNVEAVAALGRYRLLRPKDLEAALENAVWLRDIGRAGESAAAFREALALGPVSPVARMELLFTLRQICAWDESEPLLAELLASRSCDDLAGWVVPFFELSLPLSPVRLRDDAAKHSRNVTAGITPHRHPPAAPLGGRRLRVGYVSADFREHPLSHLMQGLFRHHDRSSVEVFLYSIGPDDGSAYRKRIAADAEHFVDLASFDIEYCVARIREDSIDVLVDLMGHTTLNRLRMFAYRPAPVQATYMGFAGTLGADCIDYQIVDRTIVPPELAPSFTERLVYLPDTYMVTDDAQVIETNPLTRASCDLPEGAVVLACFNAPQKIEPEVFESWMRIMNRVPGSVLWLLGMAEAAQKNLRSYAAQRGVTGDRLVFAPRWRKAAHLARLQLADVALDTFYFGAHTTAVDALWAGLPFVTCPGQTFASRVGASVLGAMGLPELIAADRDAYEALAVRLAEHPDERAELRRRLAENRATQPLFDTRRFARHFERAFHMMHEARLAADPTRVLEVPRVD